MQVQHMLDELMTGEKFDPSKIGKTKPKSKPEIEFASMHSADLVTMDENAPDPNRFGVPHPFYRVHQWPTCEFVRDQDVQATVVEQPTGSGKSAVAKTLSSRPFWGSDENVRAIVLTRTKALQDQYGGEYNAHLMKGKSNYACVHPDAPFDLRADECLFADRGMHKCDSASDCPYLYAKRLAMTEPFVCTNYAYWLSSQQLKQDMMSGKKRVLVCDEAHLLSDITLDWSGTTIHHYDRLQYELPSFPKIKRATSSSVMAQMFDDDRDVRSQIEIALDWLLHAQENVATTLRNLIKMAPFGDDNARKEALKTERFLKKLENTIDAIQFSETDWFIQSGPGVVYYRGKNIPGLVIRPLTARHQFARLFLGSTRSLLMSATIGDPLTFAEELGLGDDYAFRAVPNQYPPSARCVRVLDTPRMGYKSKPADYDKQADAIAHAILSVDPSWSGIIHVTKKQAAKDLAERLARRGLQDRIWVPPIKRGRFFLSTTEQLAEWEKRKAWKSNSVMIAWQYKEGFDGRREKICISAKTPFPYLGDAYEGARQKFSGSFYLQRTAWDLVQSLGRTRRGRIDDYDFDNQINGLVAIADMNFKRVRKYMPQDILEALSYD